MTLKKCTVTQLDADFWRMDGEGESVEVGRIDIELPTILMRSGWGFFFLEAGPNPAHESIDRLLEVVGFTRHDPKPETAEERVRAVIAKSARDRETIDLYDLRAILAELDRLRKDMCEVSEMLFASKVEVERLRSGMMPAAQRPVDVGAVLAPVREAAKDFLGLRTENIHSMASALESGHVAEAESHERAARLLSHAQARVERAIAEAEKIARGE